MKTKRDDAIQLVDTDIFSVTETESKDLILTFKKQVVFEKGDCINIESSAIYQKALQEKTKPNPKVKKIYECWICRTEFSTKKELIEDLKSHYEEASIEVDEAIAQLDELGISKAWE